MSSKASFYQHFFIENLFLFLFIQSSFLAIFLPPAMFQGPECGGESGRQEEKEKIQDSSS